MSSFHIKDIFFIFRLRICSHWRNIVLRKLFLLHFRVFCIWHFRVCYRLPIFYVPHLCLCFCLSACSLDSLFVCFFVSMSVWLYESLSFCYMDSLSFFKPKNVGSEGRLPSREQEMIVCAVKCSCRFPCWYSQGTGKSVSIGQWTPGPALTSL